MCLIIYPFSLWCVLLKKGGGPSRAVVLVMVTTMLALRESLAQEKSGVGTLSIIHHLHLVLHTKEQEKKRKSFCTLHN